MSQGSERRQKARQRAASQPGWVILQNVPGRSGEVRAKVVDASDYGVGVELPFSLREDEVVIVKAYNGHGPSNGKMKARVVHCTSHAEGYRAGLLFEEPHAHATSTHSIPETVDGVVDYYEILQVNPKADPDTIHRVFRLLAQRYHPDNAATGDDQAFRAIADAYKILSDPEKRAAFDVSYQASRMLRWQIFDQRQASTGKAAEKSKRRGILELLYAARRNQPAQPAMTLHELEDLLGCPREHLEFSLWYLKENGLITRSDNARYAITAKGVDYAESEFPEQERSALLLPSAKEST